MKSYEALTEEEKRKAHAVALQKVIEEVCQGKLYFDDRANGDYLQARIDAAIGRAQDEEAPWFAAELVYEAARTALDEIAQALAEETLYLEAGERAIHLGDIPIENRHAQTQAEGPAKDRHLS